MAEERTSGIATKDLLGSCSADGNLGEPGWGWGERGGGGGWGWGKREGGGGWGWGERVGWELGTGPLCELEFGVPSSASGFKGKAKRRRAGYLLSFVGHSSGFV